MNKGAVVLLSGGQDSTTCLYWAKMNYEEGNIFALIIDYGQRHAIEIESAKKIAEMADVPYKVLSVDFFKDIGNSALLDDTMDVSNSHEKNDKLPASFVPGRNLIFITAAAMMAYKLGYSNIVTGVCETDYSGYPDCRKETIDSLESTLWKGMEHEIRILTPLMYLNKEQTVRLAWALSTSSNCWEALGHSHTCYNGLYPPCGICPSCVLRAKGFEDADRLDPVWERYYKENE